MFCRKCYSPLDGAVSTSCRNCSSRFDPSNKKTYLTRPFPRWTSIAAHLFLTTLIAGIVALAVSFHQAASTSGH